METVALDEAPNCPNPPGVHDVRWPRADGEVTSHGIRVRVANAGSSDQSDGVEELDADGNVTVYCNDCGSELF